MARRKRASELWSAPTVPPDWRPKIATREDLEPLIDRLPASPGVYVMRDREGHVVYVGKARKLKQRVRQYFSGHDPRYFVPLLGDLLGDIETIVVTSDKEALLLENNLIKQYRPRFNFRLRDDKQYLVLRLDPAATWPRLELVRNIHADGARYWGPYHSAGNVRATLKVIHRHFQLRTCSDHVLAHRKRPCLQYQIGRCPAPCVYEVDADAYAAQVRDVERFLSGRRTDLTRDLKTRMREASAQLEFERAAKLRDQLRALYGAGFDAEALTGRGARLQEGLARGEPQLVRLAQVDDDFRALADDEHGWIVVIGISRDAASIALARERGRIVVMPRDAFERRWKAAGRRCVRIAPTVHLDPG